MKFLRMIKGKLIKDYIKLQKIIMKPINVILDHLKLS
jgi:hypothetical protein